GQTACTASLSSTLNPGSSSDTWQAGEDPAKFIAVMVTTQPGCSWTASSSATWLALGSARGIGSGNLTYTFHANNCTSHSPLVGTINVASIPIVDLGEVTGNARLRSGRPLPRGPTNAEAVSSTFTVTINAAGTITFTAGPTLPAGSVNV